ncbi:hypothetical protein ACUXV3_18015 [Roseobacteraceae bacterium NS-SX3]
MPNALAYLMLLIWPLACAVMFRRLPLDRAILWSLIAGYLLLPPVAEFDLPLVPDMNKYTIPSLAAFALCAWVWKRPVPLLPRQPVVRILTGLFVLSVIPTVYSNGDPIQFRSIVNAEPIEFITGQRPGLSLRDLGSVVINQMIVLLPFLLARRYLSAPAGLRELVLAVMLAGLAYTLPSLIEIRLSPQINIWVYGFFQHDFSQMMRQGGFRPIVFLPHALWLAFFLMTAVMAAAALARAAEGGDRVRFACAALYLFAVLVLCKSLASLAYGLIFVPVVALAPVRWQVRLALALALVAVIYPVLRNAGLVPTDAILAQAEAISADRAQSLGYRFANEALLLERAAEKPLFGWGGWGRNLVRDMQSGQIETIPDGRWIIVFGTFGWAGYIAEMGLLAAPLLLLALELRKRQVQEIAPFAAPVALMLAANMVDMLINATLIPLTWLCAGAVLGYAERLRYPGLFEQKRPLFGGTQAMQGPDPAKGPRSVM